MMPMLSYEFTDKKISPWGGIRIVQELYEKCGLKEIIESAPLKEPGSNRGYSPIDVIEGFMVSVILGAKRLSHSALLRHDEVIKEIFGWDKGMASQSTFSRFFRKYDIEDNDRIFPSIQKQWFEKFAIEKVTVDIDSTILTRYGTQEGVEKGYNPNKKGRGSHHPLLAFAAELKMVINAWMRTGHSGASTDFQDFFSEMLDILPQDRIGLIRGDAGFYGKHTLQRIEKEEINYIIAAHFKKGLRTQVMEQSHWMPFSEKENTGMDYCSFDWKATGWKKSRRFVVIRKDVDKHSQVGGKLLFPQVEEFERYRYVAFVTDLTLSAPMIWRLYNQRADAENRIKELKYDYGIEGFCLDDFGATENVFRWVMVAHNLMSLFKLSLLRHKKHLPTLSTLNFQCIAIGSYLRKSARKKILKLSVRDKRKQFIESLFSKLHGLGPPFQFSIE
jgi:hypothetical protein